MPQFSVAFCYSGYILIDAESGEKACEKVEEMTAAELFYKCQGGPELEMDYVEK